MIYELAHIEVIPGKEAEFRDAVAEALPHLLGAHGCRNARLARSIEHPSRFRLIVEWDELEDHTVGFRNSGAFTEWRRIVSPYFASLPEVEHLDMVIERTEARKRSAAGQISPASGLDGSA